MTTNPETRVEEQMVRRAFATLTGRSGAPVHWTLMSDTPVGTIGLAEAGHGLARLHYVSSEDDFAAMLLNDFAERPVLRGPMDAVRKDLDRYFTGKSLQFTSPVDLSEVSPFDRKVLAATARIPAGRFKTYSQVAKEAGNERASRAAGNALHNNPVAIIVPCHRVLRRDGSLGGYAGGLTVKEWLLRHEGAVLL